MALLKAILEKAREEEEARLNFEPEEESEEKKLGLIPIPSGPITKKKGDLDLKCIDGKVVTNEVILRQSSRPPKQSSASSKASRSSSATPTSSSSSTSSPSKSASLPRPSSGLGNFRSVQPPDIRVRSPRREDDVGLEDESENVYEEDFDVEEERTELSVSRYDIPDVFTQKGSQGALPERRPSSRPVSAASASSRTSTTLLLRRGKNVSPGLRSAPPMSSDFHKYKHVFIRDPRFRDYFMSTEQRLKEKYQELNYLLNQEGDLPGEKLSNYAHQIGQKASTRGASSSASPRQRPVRNISVYYLRKKKKEESETVHHRPTSAPPGGLPKIRFSGCDRRASPSILKGKSQRKQEGYESDASSDHGSAKKVTFVEPEWRKEKEARKKNVDLDGKRLAPPRILEEDDDKEGKTAEDEDDVLSEIRKMQQRDSADDEGDEEDDDDDDDTRSGRRSSLGFAPSSVEKESSSEGEKGEDEEEEEEEEEEDEREATEERKRRRAKTAKGLRQKTTKSRSEESDEPESGDSGILTDNEREEVKPGSGRRETQRERDRRCFVDHHLKYSQDARLINWLKKKNNELLKMKSKIRKEEREYKRREKQRQVEAEEKRKQSEAAVQSWFAKKNDQEKVMRKKYLEMLSLTTGAEWDAMSDEQKKMVRQMVVSADGDTRKGRVDDSVEEEIRRLKAEEESRFEALKRDKTEVKKEIKEEKKEKTEEEIEREMEEALKKLGEWEGVDAGQVFANEDDGESEQKEKDERDAEDEEEEEEISPERLKERQKLEEEKKRRRKIVNRNMTGYRQDEIKKDPYYLKLLQDIKANKVVKGYPPLGSLKPPLTKPSQPLSNLIQQSSKKSSRRAGTSMTTRSSRSGQSAISHSAMGQSVRSKTSLSIKAK